MFAIPRLRRETVLRLSRLIETFGRSDSPAILTFDPLSPRQPNTPTFQTPPLAYLPSDTPSGLPHRCP
jgi:hypothetical protein